MNKIAIQGGVSTGRAWNGEPRQKEKFKARKAQLGVRGKVKSAKKYTLKFKKDVSEKQTVLVIFLTLDLWLLST